MTSEPIEDLLQALRFYAQMERHPIEVCHDTVVIQDRGKKAVKALAKYKRWNTREGKE